MGSDQRLTVVRTSTPSKRRLLIMKDSFGNALPGYLFFSFGEIHVVDSRYFLKNMKDYVTQNKITDILLPTTSSRLIRPISISLTCASYRSMEAPTAAPVTTEKNTPKTDKTASTSPKKSSEKATQPTAEGASTPSAPAAAATE